MKSTFQSDFATFFRSVTFIYIGKNIVITQNHTDKQITVNYDEFVDLIANYIFRQIKNIITINNWTIQEFQTEIIKCKLTEYVNNSDISKKINKIMDSVFANSEICSLTNQISFLNAFHDMVLNHTYDFFP